MDIWIDIIEDNTAAVFCCGIGFMVNTDINPRGLSVLLKNLLATARLCEISYDTLFEHQGVKLCS